MASILWSVLSIALIIGVGWVARRAGALGPEAAGSLASVTYWVASPAMLFHAIVSTGTSGVFGAPLAVAAASGVGTALLFVAVALLIYQIEYMTMYVTVQLLSAAHLVLLFISFMILPNETGYLPIIVGEAVLAFACYRVYRQAWAAPEYSLFWRRALAW